jgi:hypothetical protein
MSILAPQLPFVRDQNGRGVPVLPNLPPNLPFVPGNIWHVRPRLGSDVNASGKNWQSAFKTLRRAKEVAVANQNDVVLFAGEGNASANCTDYQNGLLTWDKDLVHLIGVNSGVSNSPRSRIAFTAAYAAATDLFKVTAHGCYFQGIQFWEGVASALPTGCMTITGRLNKFKNCHIVGIGDAANDIAGAFSLNLKGAIQNEFEDCVIGTYTTSAGAASGGNSQILYTGTGSAATCSAGNRFKRCIVYMKAIHGTYHLFIVAGSASIGASGAEVYEDCLFINSGVIGGSALTNAFSLHDSAGGIVVLAGNTLIVGAGHTLADATSSVLYGPQATAYSVATALLSQQLGG